MTKYLIAAAALGFAPIAAGNAQDNTEAAAATGEANAQVAAGAMVYGPEGNPVGQVASVENGIATVDTGTYKVGLPLDRFGEGENGPVISVTQADLNAMMEKATAEAAAALDAKLVAGAPVADVNGVAIGSVEKIEGEDVTVTTEWGAFALKKDAFMATDTGVTAQVMADQIKTALEGAAAAAS